MDNENKGKKKFSLSTQIMIGMGLGFGAGIFFGEYCAFLQIIGNAFIKLLQITILPYIIVSMILGIGGLTADQAKLMVKKAGILMLLFILFAAWFSGSTFSLMQYPTFVFAGLLSFFGGVDVAMPFMLDLMRIPADLYQLYVVTGIINGRFATLLAAMNLVIFTLLATASMNVKLEFFPFEFDTMAAQLKARQFDLIMGGVAVTTPRLEKLAYSAPYMQATLAFIVPDHRRSEFASSQAVKSISDLKIGIPHMADYFFDKVKNYLPQAEVIEVKSAREFFEANEQQIDALLWGAENGAAWTLLYPKFQVVAPVPDVAKIPVAYPIGGGDREFAEFVSQWIMIKKNGLKFPRLYDHWILGKDAVPKQPRWSIIRDVFKWVQ
jgi:ABC-type amino acid transport substrate-binding protein